VALCFWIGIYPKPFLAFLHAPMARLADTVQPGRFAATTAPTARSATDEISTTPLEEPRVVPEVEAPAAR